MVQRSTSLSRFRARATGAGAAASARVQLYAHRGGAGLMPENTLPAYETCLPQGVDAIDGDLAMTRDRVIVVSHDQKLKPAITRRPRADGRLDFIPGSPAVPIKNLSLDELSAYDVGSIDPSSSYARAFPDQRQLDGVRIPTLASVVELLQRPEYARTRLNVEIKANLRNPDDPAYWDPTVLADRLLRQLDEADMLARTDIQCFDWTVLQHIQRQRTGVTLAFLSTGGYEVWLDWFSRTYSPDRPVDIDSYAEKLTATIREIAGAGSGEICIWEPYWGPFQDARGRRLRALTRPMVELAHRRGLPVVPWTLDDAEGTAFVLSLGVDGLLTNRVDVARDVLAAEGLEPPPAPGTC